MEAELPGTNVFTSRAWEQEIIYLLEILTSPFDKSGITGDSLLLSPIFSLPFLLNISDIVTYEI